MISRKGKYLKMNTESAGGIKDPETDAVIKDMFEEQIKAAKELKLGDITLTPRGSLALIILLDQFSRNIYRDTADAFSQDKLALNIALSGIDKGLELKLHPL